MSPAEQRVVAGWWRSFAATGAAPEGFERVQGRLIRAVHRARLEGRDVYVKTMTFPRAKDRVRYLLRSLPAEHEARMLQSTAAAGIPCPEVVAARTCRRVGLPHRSMLVLRALPVARGGDPAPGSPSTERATAEVALAARLLAAGIYHGDLHGDNFVSLESGELAVLDMQSARAVRGDGVAERLAVAARMLRDRGSDAQRATLAAMRSHGLLTSDDEAARALRLRDAGRAAYERSRIQRCLRTSTEFERRLTWWGVRYERRDRGAGGRWVRGGRALGDAWIGQRVLELRERQAPRFGAYFRKWWWLGGGAGLYVAAPCSAAQIEAEVEAAAAAARSWRRPRPA